MICNYKYLSFAFLFLLILPGAGFTQRIDSLDRVIMAEGHYAFHVPGGDLSDRFGMNSAIGAGMMFKNSGNWLFGFDGNYLFGSDVKEDSLFTNIETSSGYIIDGQGKFADVRLYERGFYLMAKIGKLFPVSSKNRNSGVFCTVGSGFLQHKIRIENPGNSAPQIEKDYKKGYDRLTNGFSISEMVGFMYMGKSRVVNFYAGFEFIQGWTESRRDYDFDTMTTDTRKRFDSLWGFKIGWIIPFNARMPEKYYYF